MTNTELKEALITEEPIIFNDIEYKCISGIIYRKNKFGNGLIIQAELLDQKTQNSVTIASPHRITRKEGMNEE